MVKRCLNQVTLSLSLGIQCDENEIYCKVIFSTWKMIHNKDQIYIYHISQIRRCANTSLG